MAKLSRPRFGSLQYWPRKRAAKALPRVNWKAVSHNKSNNLMGLIAYKVGMGTALVRDKTEKSLTQNKKMVLPVTILEVPKAKIFSVRFYKHGKVMSEIIVSHDKELKRLVKLPKQLGKFEEPQGYDEIRAIIYTVMKDMNKKTPNLSEIALPKDKALEFVKNHIGKEISMKDILSWSLIDVHGLTRGKGLVGPVKRFGIGLKSHKSEKGVRRPGSLGPWHPARVTFRTPIAGQLGMFTRVQYNLPIIVSGSSAEGHFISPKIGFKNYGVINHDYIIVVGSVQGPAKRELIVTPAQRPTKKQAKKKYEFLELRR